MTDVDENEGCFWIAKEDSEQMRCYSDVWRLGAYILYNESKVEYEPAVTNLDETIEESFEDKIVSQETQASYCLVVFLNQRASSVIFISNWIKWT